ncbi:hypothetical protein GF324_11180, partial [bacterium]|nr:hypothetical protein [bacterium]
LIMASGPLLLLSLPGIEAFLPPHLHTGAWVFSFVPVILYLLFISNPKPLKVVMLSVQLLFGRRKRILEALRVYEDLAWRHLANAFLVTIVQLGIILTQFFLITRAFVPVDWLPAAHTYAATLFVKSVLPITLGSLGIGEFAAVSFYAGYGVSDAVAFSASLLLFAVNVLLPAILGAVYLMFQRPSFRNDSQSQERSSAA